MLPNCNLVTLLKTVQAGAHERHFTGLEYVADAALNIIRDAHNNYLTELDSQTIADLMREIERSGCCSEPVAVYLQQNAHDCDICHAVAARLATK